MPRKLLHKISSFRTISVFFMLSLSVVANAFEVQVVASGNTLQVSTSSSEVKFLSVNVWNADGDLVFNEASDGANVTWILDDTAGDGRYKYEVKSSNIVAGSRSRESGEIATKALVSTESGSVLLQSGSFVLPSSEEESATTSGAIDWLKGRAMGLAMGLLNAVVSPTYADIVQNDDVISNFSQCVGQDCIDGENFGFDTVRLKENNVRIHFQDTSNTASFPSNDWRIIINDSTNGGENYFGIEDASTNRNVFVLEAGAPANALVVDDSGLLGIGTSNPSTTIEGVTGNTPTLRLNQDGSQGFAAQTWDVGGNEEGFFLRDVTNGSTLPFRVNSGAPTDSFVVNPSGNIGVGVNSPTEKLHVVGNAIISGNLELGSSRGIKNQIRRLDLNQAMTAFDSLEPVMFRYNHSPDEQSIGFIAEDVPDLVATESRKSLKPMDIIAVLTKVVQEQQKTIDALSSKIDGLIEEKSAEYNKR